MSLHPFKAAAAAAVSLALISGQAAAGVIYVDADAPGLNNGNNWTNAYTGLHTALAFAAAGDDIWIAEGTYTPTSGTSSFFVPAGVRLYGGFIGNETSLGQRDPTIHFAILSGDINGDDQPGFVNRTDNANHVLWLTQPDADTRLDGLVVRGGYADTFPQEGGGLVIDGGTVIIDECLFIDNWSAEGGAIYVDHTDTVRIRDSVCYANSINPSQTSSSGGAVSARSSDLLIERCEFALNSSRANTSTMGGAVNLSSCTARFEDCTFTENFTDAGTNTSGGALSVFGGATDLARCVFERNNADSDNTSYAGAIDINATMFESAAVRVAGCQFLGNTSKSEGGAITVSGDATLDLVDSLIAGNSSSQGTAISNLGVLTISSSTIANNDTTSVVSHAGLYSITGSQVTIDNSILWANGGGDTQSSEIISANPPTINHSCVQGWTGSLGGAGNFGDDPLFFDADGLDNTHGTADDNYTLKRFSPCIDAGDNAAVPPDDLDLDADGNTTEKIPLDVYGRDRRHDDPDVADTGNGNAPFVDIGAVELQLRSCPADLDVNGILDLADITAFITGFTGLDPIADLDGNGIWDLADIVLFVGFFNAGCP
ncbi:MAG: hypothetical protein H6810_02235 [Phycisphaeraceae bacterium]|nr:MAG: hypothetical protein H6810_02235 [Phycisphaeraceae bacterium]